MTWISLFEIKDVEHHNIRCDCVSLICANSWTFPDYTMGRWENLEAQAKEIVSGFSGIGFLWSHPSPSHRLPVLPSLVFSVSLEPLTSPSKRFSLPGFYLNINLESSPQATWKFAQSQREVKSLQHILIHFIKFKSFYFKILWGNSILYMTKSKSWMQLFGTIIILNAQNWSVPLINVKSVYYTTRLLTPRRPTRLESERKEIKNIVESLVGLASITKATFDLWRVSSNRNKSSFHILQHSDWYF